MSERALLRHAVATLAYRGGKALRGAPAEFATFQSGGATRTPVEILAHIGDLLDWAVELAKGRHTWKSDAPKGWGAETVRFFDGLARFDAVLASDDTLGSTERKLFQGPVADALTHVGQINLLRGLFQAPVKGENYFKADIETGRVGAEQAPPRIEF